MTTTSQGAATIAEPFFFGSGETPLFGSYDRPRPGRQRQSAVVLCYSFGPEYVNGHRTFRRLATLLSNAGFPVLRFDYYGCGDSAGDGEDGDLEVWKDNLGVAIDETRRRSGLEIVNLIGLRLGASLAMMASSRRSEVANTVLWDPVVAGTDYIDDLSALHRKSMRGHMVKIEGGDSDEVLGFPFPPRLRQQIADVDLLSIEQLPAGNVLVIGNEKKDSDGPLMRHLEKLGPQSEYRHIPGPEVWVYGGDTLVPGQVVQAIVSWTSEVAS